MQYKNSHTDRDLTFSVCQRYQIDRVFQTLTGEPTLVTFSVTFVKWLSAKILLRLKEPDNVAELSIWSS